MAVYLEKRDVGATLTTWIYCAMWQLYAAKMTGRTGYVHWPRDPARALQPYFDDAMFDKCPNMFDWYLEQPTWTADVPPPCDETWVWEYGVPEMGQHHLMSLPLADIKAFYRENCRLNADVRVRGQAIADKYAIDFANTIGITWRGTDCVTDGRPRMPIETYFPFIDDILTERPELRIAATAEEEGVLEPLLARYPQAFVIEEFASAANGSKHNPERFDGRTGYERGMQPALMVWLFSQCAFYVKNRSSSGMVASWLSTGKIVCLAHPENGGYEFDLTKAEIEGKLVPLCR